MRYHVVDDSGNNVGELGQFSAENGGVFLGGTLFCLAMIWLIIKAIVALLTFLLPALLGAAIATALGRPWGRISGGLMAGTGAYGVSILHNGLVLHSSHQDARGALGVGCALCGFAIVLLGLKLREVVRVRRDGYDDSPWTLQYLGSWAVVIAPYHCPRTCLDNDASWSQDTRGHRDDVDRDTAPREQHDAHGCICLVDAGRKVQIMVRGSGTDAR
ncbi:MAG: hypothetical protein M3Y74_17870 [Chloroflexota bacterium]|nr:hypothetical protein [Chloroflexota bacterium]